MNREKTIMTTTTRVTYRHGFSGFAVPDLEAASTFYREVLGLDAGDGGMGTLRLTLPGGADVFIYPKEDHEPAVFTILNLEVDDIDQAVDVLAERGVEFLRYDGFQQDERGIASDGEGPRIAWFTDPAGNIFSILQN
jgi:predicted enzyme related to lactoylglutathione lyase